MTKYILLAIGTIDLFAGFLFSGVIMTTVGFCWIISDMADRREFRRMLEEARERRHERKIAAIRQRTAEITARINAMSR